MLNFKQIGFCSILFLLLAACDDRGGVSPYGGTGGAVLGDSAGVAVLISNSGSNLSQMSMQIYGTGGQSALAYNGTAQFQGKLMFSNVYNSQNAYHQYPVTSGYSAYPSSNQCQSGGSIAFKCQGRLFNEGNFDCQANLVPGGSHRIYGILGSPKTTSQNYEIVSVTVDGPCTFPVSPGRVLY